MAEDKNALTELAANLIDATTAIAETGLIEDRHVDTINRAQRIVAELAKVQDCTFRGNPRVDQSADAVIVCRAIAEEGGEK